ncbi:MAG: DUF5335 family protein [Thermoanaerobaculia bacterium]
MPTLEIPREEWKAFCDRFSREHEGWLATLEVLDEAIGAQVEAEDLPLEGITAASKGSGGDAIEIFLRAEPDGTLTHFVADPTRLWVLSTDAGAEEALEIEAPGSKTILRFRSAMPADMVDGIAGR